MFPAMQKAVEANRHAIVALLMACGPQEYWQIKRECATQAYADDESIQLALRGLVADGRVIEDAEDGDTFYDLSDEDAPC